MTNPDSEAALPSEAEETPVPEPEAAPVPEPVRERRITLPELSLVLLVGPSGCGKSTFARKHFKPTEVLSSDYFRGLVSDDENNQEASRDAFELLHAVAARRLERGLLTVVDATNVQPEARKPLVELARRHHVFPVALVFNLPEGLCHERNRERSDRQFGPHVVRGQREQMRRSLGGLQREGVRTVHVLTSPEEVDAVRVERQPLWTDRKGEHGPFDIIGDVHGCFGELTQLLALLGYGIEAGKEEGGGPAYLVRPPEGRKAIFLGDLVDRGPNSPAVLRLVMGMVEAGSALCVPGNHDVRLLRKLRGRNVEVKHGLAQTLEQMEKEPPEFTERVARFLDGLVSHYVLDEGRLVVAHAGMKASLQGRASGRVRDFALYGETTGETDEFGLPIRYNWAAEYRGKAVVVYGHTPVPQPEWLNRTINIDTGCAFGGALTALRYPEREFVSVPAVRTYAEPIRPFLPPPEAAPLTAQQQHDDVLDLEDVLGKRIISTRLAHNVTIREENATAALEVMSRFAANPKWLLYLPPTMAPSETSRLPGLLEHPAEAFAYYRGQGVSQVVCEEKHMGSRAVVIVCRDEETARRRFGVLEEESGICYTRTGRRFFEDAALEREVLALVRTALDRSGAWEGIGTDWVCLDCELMPWSAKAQALLAQQYAPVGAAARAGLGEVVGALAAAATHGGDVAALQERFAARQELAEKYVEAYRRYCWEVRSVQDLKLAPFHILASEGKVHTDRDHVWHMERLKQIAAAGDGLLMATPWRVVDLADEGSQEEAIRWWEELTERGGEGMVVKPLSFIARGRKGLVQPALKCRGPEYLRIIYGPEYSLPENLERLRQRGLSGKRSLALREFALGMEGLERFVRGEPLRRVHECVFGVLALESEPVDPRL
jgi:protein phosphatase